MSKKIFLDAPNIGEYEEKKVNEALKSGFVSTCGPFVGEFEERFAGYIGAERAVSMQSGTAALHMALHELGIGRDDEVIVPALTFVATVNPVTYVGAKPVFADVNVKTWNIDPSQIEKKITEKTRAIIPVHLYGNPCDMDEIMEIAKKNDLYVIEDATESLGSKYNGWHTGTFGDMGCFSFNGNKTITTGGGGMVVSNDGSRMKHLKFLVNQARDEEAGYYHPEVGFNYRMTNLEAALGLAQMDRSEVFFEKKKKFNEIYKREFAEFGFIRFQKEYERAEGLFWLTCIVFDEKMDLGRLQERLKEKGIPTRRIFMPVVRFPFYGKFVSGEYPNSDYIYERGLGLPSSTLNSEEDIHYVCENIKDLVSRS
ncbi:MAG: aminotransferase class V-fold PLP-dependent enzyme [Candidatus Omnitrophota bacterium]